MSLIWESSKAFQISWSLCCESGSKFFLRTERALSVYNFFNEHGEFISSESTRRMQLRNASRIRYFASFAYLIVPLNIIASCGMADNRDRNIRRGTCRMSIPSKSTRPWLISISRKRAMTLEDFPLPVLPQIPNYECQLKRISFVSSCVSR